MPDSSGEDPPPDDPFEDRQSMRWLSYGIEFIAVLAIFTFFGYWADKKYNTEPWLMVTGLTIGFIGMIYLLFKETEKWRK